MFTRFYKKTGSTDNRKEEKNDTDPASTEHRRIKPIAEMLSAKIQLNNMRLPV